ncbi:MAG: hypothetical protein DWH83_06890 [Planctomycetota bacterium]|nr:MAG: hypothetical protein DWH83_06890 [Planctomycetota bacterium]
MGAFAPMFQIANSLASMVEVPMNSPKAPYEPRAKLMARVGEEFPWACPSCGGDIRLIAFITEPGPVWKILTHLGEFPELLDDKRAGLLHVPGDPADLARAITAILDDESLAARRARIPLPLADRFDARPSASRDRV